MKYRKKSVVIDAIRLKELSGCDGTIILNPFDCLRKRFLRKGYWIKTLEGWYQVKIGDWIIKGVIGEYYPCNPDVFEQTYEKVENESI